MRRFFQRLLKRKTADSLAEGAKAEHPSVGTVSMSTTSPTGEVTRETDRIQSRLRKAAESILENETLTAELEDSAAQLALDWGMQAARQAALSTAGLEEAQAEQALDLHLQAVRRMLRAAAQLATLPVDTGTADFDPLFRQLTVLYAQVYGSSQVESELIALMDQLNRDWSQLTDPRERIVRLRQVLERTRQAETPFDGRV